MGYKRIYELDEVETPDNDDYFLIDATQKEPRKISYMDLGLTNFEKVNELPNWGFALNKIYLIKSANPTQYHNYDKYLLVTVDKYGGNYDVTDKINLADVEWIYENIYGTIDAYNNTWYVRFFENDSEITDDNTIYFDHRLSCYYKSDGLPDNYQTDFANFIGNWEKI